MRTNFRSYYLYVKVPKERCTLIDGYAAPVNEYLSPVILIFMRGHMFNVVTLDAEEKLLNRIVVNLKVMAGKPVIKGRRIPMEQILKLLA